MTTTNSADDLEEERKSAELEPEEEVPGTDFSTREDDGDDLNPLENKNDSKYNGEAEKDFSRKTDDFLDKNHTKTIDNTKHYTATEFSRPAGLSSDRCIRDFMSAKNRKYHWNSDKTHSGTLDRDTTKHTGTEPDFETESNYSYRSVNTYKSYNSLENSNSLKSTEHDSRDSEANYIFKSNWMQRHQNRMRNTRHSDIFGVAEDNSLKRSLSNQSSRSDQCSKYSDKSNFYSKYDNASSVDGESRCESREGSVLGSVDKRMKRANFPPEVHNCGPGKEPSSNAPKKDQIMVNIVCLKLSGLKSETCEKDLENMCRCCKLQILSINLDRNIITHSCSGTGLVKLKNPGRDNLNSFRDMLRSHGFNFKV